MNGFMQRKYYTKHYSYKSMFHQHRSPCYGTVLAPTHCRTFNKTEIAVLHNSAHKITNDVLWSSLNLLKNDDNKM
jgi:hypothetical protein